MKLTHKDVDLLQTLIITKILLRHLIRKYLFRSKQSHTMTFLKSKKIFFTYLIEFINYFGEIMQHLSFLE